MCMCMLCVVCCVLCVVCMCVDMVVRMCCVLWCVRCVVVLCVCFVVCVVLWCCCFVWCGAAWDAENPLRVRIQNASVCPRKRPHVLNMRAFSGYTRRRLERTHGGVLNPHTEEVFYLLFSLLSLFPLLSSLSSFSATMTMITRSVGSLCTQSSDLPECQCACALAHSLAGEHVHIICKKQLSWKTVQASCHLE